MKKRCRGKVANMSRNKSKSGESVRGARDVLGAVVGQVKQL